jgi:uncharacterized protein (DUF1330 family)
VLFVQIVRIPAEGVASFQRFESRVLPLLARHGGRLERRLRAADGQTEIHVISFPDVEALERYRGDPERTQHLPLLEQSGASSELLEVTDIPVD